MTWWGRAGKIFQFLGGLAVILDLVGPDRLRAWGAQLRETNTASLERVRKILPVLHKLPFALTLHWWRMYGYFKDPGYARTKAERDKRRQEREILERVELERFSAEYPIRLWPVLLTAALFAILPLALLYGAVQGGSYAKDYSNSALPWLAIPTAVAWTFLPGIVVTMLEFCSIAARATLNRALLRPIANGLAATRPGLGIRWGAVVAIVVGFILDLLSS